MSIERVAEAGGGGDGADDAAAASAAAEEDGPSVGEKFGDWLSSRGSGSPREG